MVLDIHPSTGVYVHHCTPVEALMSPARLVRILVVLAAITSFARQSQAQLPSASDTTSPPTPAVGHDYVGTVIDTVNPANGSVSIRIPVRVSPGRQLTIPLSIAYDSAGAFYYGQSQGSQIPHYATIINVPFSRGGWSYTFPLLTFSPETWTATNGVKNFTCTAGTSYVFQDSTGNRHNLSLAPVSSPSAWQPYCGGNGDGIVQGGEGPILASTQNGNGGCCPPVYVSEGDGTLYSFVNAVNATNLPATIIDRNGNTISVATSGTPVSSASFTDTLGRTAVSVGTFIGNPDNITVAGLSSPYQVSWTTASASFTIGVLNLNLGISPAACPTSLTGSTNVVSQVLLPNGQKYTFTYNTTYGMLNKITSPTGGYVRYVWGLNAQSEYLSAAVYASNGNTTNTYTCRYDSPAITDRYVSFDGTTEVLHQHYAYGTTWQSGTGSWTSKTTTVTTTDQVRNTSFTTVYAYSPIQNRCVPDQNPNANDDGCIGNNDTEQTPVEQCIESYDATGSGGTPPAPCPNLSPSGKLLKTVIKSWANNNPRTLGSLQTVLDNGQSSLVVNCYDINEQITETDEYDFGSAAPTLSSCARVPSGTVSGPALRKTAATYAAFTKHIIDKLATVITSDGSGNRVAETDYSTYDANANLKTKTEQCFSGGQACSQGNSTTTYTYDSNGQLLTETDPCGNTSCGDMSGSNHTTTYSYTDTYAPCNGAAPPTSPSDAYLTQVTRPQTTNGISHITTYCYDYTRGLLLSATDENSQTTSYAYADSLDRLTQTSYPDGGQATYSYNDTPPSPSVTSSALISSGKYLTNVSAMDGMGHVVQTQLTTDPSGTDYNAAIFDGLGRTYKAYNPTRCNPPTTNCSESAWGYTTSVYDALGRIISLTAQDGSTTTTSYSGNCATATDPAGAARKSCSDGLGRLTQVVEDPGSSPHLNYETDYGYDALGNLLCVGQKGTNSGSYSGCSSIPSTWRPRLFSYDSLSQLVNSVNPESNTVVSTGATLATTYSYDANGNLAAKTAPSPNQQSTATVTTYSAYDVLSRPTSKSYSDGVTPTYSLTYDIPTQYGTTFKNPIGRQVLAERPCSSLMYSYDPLGRVAQEIQVTYLSCTGGAQSSTFNYAYDLAGDMTSYTNGAGVTFTQTFDGAARPTALSSSFVDSQHPASLVSTASYWPSGQLRLAQVGNTIARTQVFNSRVQPCRINYNDSDTALSQCTDPLPQYSMQDFNYGYGSAGTNNGNVASDTAVGWTNLNRSYTYDQINRLATLADTNSQQPCQGLSWAYDAWGNRTGQTMTGGSSCPTFSQSVGVQNRLISSPYQYDSAGNMTHDASHSYTYDPDGHLIQVDGTSGYCSASGNTSVATACYVYDAKGRRSVKIPSSGVWTQYFYDLNNSVVTEYGSGCGPTCWTVGYIYFNGFLLSEYKNSTTYFVHGDNLGSSSLVTDVTGAYLTDCFDYLPFGEQITPNYPCSSSNPPSRSGNTHDFTGKERDSESGLDNFGARYDSSSMGRFMSADPDDLSGAMHMEDPQSWNGYSYVRNNPLNLTDPTGTVFCRPANDAEKGQGISQVCDVTDTQYVFSSKEQQAAYDKAGYTHFDCSCDTEKDKDAWQHRNGTVSNDYIGDALVFGAVFAGLEGLFYPKLHPHDTAPTTPTPQPQNVNLADQKATTHTLDGDATGGGHRPGTGIPGKSEFPAGWSDDKIMNYISDVATDPASKTTTVGRTTVVEGTREGVNIRVIIRDNRIVTGFPTNVPRNP
jgi:RHS repeat-associated protein